MICTFNNVDVQLGNKSVLDQLNWEIKPGEVTGLLGKNGAGKSTLIRTLLGLITPSSGNVTTLGVKARDIGDTEKTRLAYVPQSAVGYEGMKVANAISVHASCYDSWDQARAEKMIERFEIPLATRVQKLSVGQRQSLMLVLALASKPDFLVMDEPVASLDPSARREVLKFISEEADRHCTILYSTHITADLHRMANNIAILDDGKIQVDRNSEELAQSFLIKGELPKEVAEREEFKSRLLCKNNSDSIYCDWNQSLAALVPSTLLVQPLNLEELFIRWHDLREQNK